MNSKPKHDEEDDPKDVKKPEQQGTGFPQPTVANPPPPQPKPTEKKDEKPAGRHP
jgi:hypothetical protein